MDVETLYQFYIVSCLLSKDVYRFGTLASLYQYSVSEFKF